MTEPEPVSVTSLEHSIWPNLHAELDATLKQLKLAHLSSPSMLILHDTLDSAVRAMQRNVFMQLVDADFGLGMEGNEESVEALYSAEMPEHGSQNIVQYCQQNGWQVNVSFPRFANDIIRGLSLTEHSGMFENYRTRMHIPGAENVSVLFNVSGYRDPAASPSSTP
ncbi:MAG: hypothetical protein WC236_06585 [Gallionellaceae bacterium]|jgi:hypothetical protein